MKCPECERQGMVSKLYLQYGPTTDMATHEFYDEEGKYHFHDPNSSTTIFKCTNRHVGAISQSRKCPSCDYGDREPRVQILKPEAS